MKNIFDCIQKLKETELMLSNYGLYGECYKIKQIREEILNMPISKLNDGTISEYSNSKKIKDAINDVPPPAPQNVLVNEATQIPRNKC